MKTPLLPGEGAYMEVGDVQGPVGNDRQGVQVNSVDLLSPLLCNRNNMIKNYTTTIFSLVSMLAHTTLCFLGNLFTLLLSSYDFFQN